MTNSFEIGKFYKFKSDVCKSAFMNRHFFNKIIAESIVDNGGCFSPTKLTESGSVLEAKSKYGNSIRIGSYCISSHSENVFFTEVQDKDEDEEIEDWNIKVVEPIVLTIKSEKGRKMAIEFLQTLKIGD